MVPTTLFGGLWCNGSTGDFESPSLGSIPSEPTTLKGTCMGITLNKFVETLQRLIDMGHGELQVKGYVLPGRGDREYDGLVYGHDDVTLKFK